MTQFRPTTARQFRRLTELLVLLLFAAPAASLSGAAWWDDAVWYQIFPERFRNGDPRNDPVPASLEGTWPYFVPNGWRISPWTSDWYQLQPWEQDGKGFYTHAQLRRYGGDLQGVLDQLDYLKALGVNALYLNPVFESASLHKYGATMYHHIDRHFGPDPVGDSRIIASEDPVDPATWKWTAADRLFLKLVREAHRRRMRIVLDGVFNHVGIPFWALQRARREGPGSRFAEWFEIRRWDDPTTPADEFDYKGWVGVKDLPELARSSTNLHPAVRRHLKDVVERWMAPRVDGRRQDGIDGWRLDVAAEVPMGFWEEFRGWVKASNPDAYITGEIWWEDYSQNTFRNAAPWLDRAFDGVMNYRFGDALFQFFLQPAPIRPSQFVQRLQDMRQEYGYSRSLHLQNLLDSHDTARIGSAVVNRQHRQDHGASVKDNPSYDVRAPNAAEKRLWKQMVAFQFLSPGAPYIYYGDEVGMWGADDPDCRKPMVWAGLRYDAERAHPFGKARQADTVSVDANLLEFHRRLAKLRTRHAELRTGDCEYVLVDDVRRLVGFRRSFSSKPGVIVAVFNASDAPAAIEPADLRLPTFSGWKDLWTGRSVTSGSMAVPPRGFAVLGGRL